MPDVCMPLASPIPPEHVVPKYVEFLHPAFPTPDAFLRLPALDTETESSSRASVGSSLKYGVHHATALEACYIIADNQPGFLSATNDRTSRIHCGPDEVLCASQYYYFLENTTLDPQYPLIMRFSDWVLPPQIPERWNVLTTRVSSPFDIAASDMSSRIHGRDIKCRISHHRDGIQNAHIIHKSELDWFLQNRMRQYNINLDLPSAQATQDLRNGILLRADIHLCFDSKKFAVVPKMKIPTVHFLKRTFNLGAVYHNVIVDLPLDMCAEFWFARFAWSLFPLNFDWDILHRPVVLRVNGVREVKQEQLPPERARSKRKRTSARGSDEPPNKKSGEADMEEAVGAVEDPSLSEHASQVDEDEEYLEDLKHQRARFPSMSQEHCYSDDRVWNQINWYPGQRKVLRQMRRYIKEHPSITALADPEKAVWVNPDD